MELTIKLIVNNLFHATVTHEGFEGAAVGYTRDEATKKALGWLKREIEAVKAKLSGMHNNQDFAARALVKQSYFRVSHLEEFKSY